MSNRPADEPDAEGVATDQVQPHPQPQSVDKETIPKVRFSKDLNRATASAAIATPKLVTPALTLDTAAVAKSPSEATASTPGLSQRKVVSPTSPTSPRTRDRGYSLRRTLFTRGISYQSQQSPIELIESGFSQADHGGRSTTTHEQGNGEKSSALTTVFLGSGQEFHNLQSQPKPRNSDSSLAYAKGRGNVSSGTINVRNYDVWARARSHDSVLVQRAYRIYKDKIYKPIFERKQMPPSQDGRHIDLDASRDHRVIDERTGIEHIGNAIRSSRYTLWDFVPRQFCYQFSKLANAYFLLVSILQMVPGLSPVGSYTTIAPLLIFVAISMGKEGWDDVRRYKLDQIENNTDTLVLNTNSLSIADSTDTAQSVSLKLGKRFREFGTQHKPGPRRNKIEDNARAQDGQLRWSTIKWKDVRVGDIIKVRRDEPIPADMVLLYADGVNGIAYIDTMALDGETNLKTKHAPPPLSKRCQTEPDIAVCRAHVVAEDPNIDLYNFDGKVTVDEETLPLTTNEIVFRGSTLRNTANAIGMVINTGEECKIRMNANKSPRIKAPAMQAISNKIVVLLVVFVVLLSLFCTIAYQIWTDRVEERSWYIRNAHVKFSFILVGFIILFNTLIPLSLYVSLEIIKVGLLLLMKDVDMYDPVSDTPMACNTTTILENLGQVDYVFSDKTGTLTDNVMRFRKLSVAGYAWLHDFDLQKEAAEKMQQNQENSEQSNRGKGASKRATSQKHTPMPTIVRNDSEVSDTGTERPGFARRASTTSIWKSSARPAKIQPELRTEELLRFMQQKPHSVFTKKAKFFLLSLALCHTCLPEVQENGDINFQAASPDELALVRAAQDCGFLVIDRAARSIVITTPGGQDAPETVTEKYDILDVVEFSSKRKRMSIIVRFPNGRICIICKGADSSILPRLKHASLALQKVSEVTRRSSKRKSLEVEEAFRRMSEHSPRNSLSLNRPSLSRSRKSIGGGRPSMASARLSSIRDELDSWLTGREHDIELAGEDMSAYQTPRPSMGRLSTASSEPRSSMQAEFADGLIDEGSVLDEAVVFERCFQHIDDFASEGLRTLLFGYRFLDEQEYAGWKKTYLDATTSLVDRQELVEKAGELIEQSFELAGATAIEDKLQQGVPETIDKLRRANIKIWMLTGDKRETAINIAHSARICKNYSEIIVLDHTTGDVEQKMASTFLDLTKGTIAHSVIVVDGQTLSEIDSNETVSMMFFDLVVLADSVICCRASPSQKASLVRKIRTKVNRSMTLAIGDGANDIAMIQEAHVGIGISGKEGLQAARISDYSIAQFRFLQKLLLVHGRWNYVRIGKYILATFWKELTFYLIQASYQKWCGYTGTSIFESTSLTVFNTLFTSLAVILLGIFEQDLAASTLLAVPELYVQGQRNEGFNIKKYLGWMIMAASESMVIYFVMFGLFGSAVFSADDSVLGIGQMCFTAAVIFINTKLLILEMHNKTLISAVGWALSIGGWFAWTLLLSAVFKPNKTYLLYPMYRDFLDHYGHDLLWWLVLFLTLAVLCLFELGVSSLRKSFWPSNTDIFQELQKDPVIWQRFEETVQNEKDGRITQAEIVIEKKRSADEQREIQELLSRPRVMIPTHPMASGGLQSPTVHSGMEATPPSPETMRFRRSVDIAEVLEGRA